MTGPNPNPNTSTNPNTYPDPNPNSNPNQAALEHLTGVAAVDLVYTSNPTPTPNPSPRTGGGLRTHLVHLS